MPIRALAFDLDGTLVDSIQDLAASANAARAALGYAPLNQDRIRSHVGDGVASLIHRALTDERHGEASPEAFKRGMEAFQTHYAAHLVETTRPFAGVVTGLAQLKASGYVLGCLTNKGEAFARRILERLDLMPYLDFVIGGDTLSEKKPSGLALHHLAKEYGIPVDEWALVGDSHNDVEAARRAGCVSIVVPYGYEPLETLSARVSIQTLLDLNPELLNHLP